MFEVQQITHYYGRTVALSDVSFIARSGIIGLLGRNGAGKSTLLRILATLLRPTQGTVIFDGVDAIRSPALLRRAAAYLPQDMGFPNHVSARTYVRYLLALRGNDQHGADQWLERLGLDTVADKKLGSYSGGMRQRTGLAYALACDTHILLLDEPTQGLDPWERTRLHTHLAELASDRLILFSTHIVSDIEAIANRVLIVDQGRLLYDGDVQSLLNHADGVPTWIVHSDMLWQPNPAYTITGVRRLTDGKLEIRAIGTPMPESAIRVTTTLEDQYLRLTSAHKPHPLERASGREI